MSVLTRATHSANEGPIMPRQDSMNRRSRVDDRCGHDWPAPLGPPAPGAQYVTYYVPAPRWRTTPRRRRSLITLQLPAVVQTVAYAPAVVPVAYAPAAPVVQHSGLRLPAPARRSLPTTAPPVVSYAPVPPSSPAIARSSAARCRGFGTAIRRWFIERAVVRRQLSAVRGVMQDALKA